MNLRQHANGQEGYRELLKSRDYPLQIQSKSATGMLFVLCCPKFEGSAVRHLTNYSTNSMPTFPKWRADDVRIA